jgi:phosphatidylglycerophosphate synthase
MLKVRELEEPFDIILYRPPAFILVKVLALGRITPNQVTLAALVPGLAAAWCFWQGTPAGYLAGAILLFCTNVLDCADGMLARVRGTSSLTGYILDGLVDYIIQAAVIVGLLVGLAGQLGDARMSWLVGVPAGLSFAWWSAMVDRMRNEWLERVYDRRRDPHKELSELQAQAAIWRHEGGHHGDRLLIWFFWLYVRLWYTAPSHLHLFECDEPAQLWQQRRRPLLRMAVLMGPTMHLTMIVIAGILGRPDWYFWTALVFGTSWGLTVLLLRAIVDRSPLFLAPREFRGAGSSTGGRSNDQTSKSES